MLFSVPFLMARLLILFAHPALDKSRVHRRLVERVVGLDGVTFNDLYESYPDFDVQREQARRIEDLERIFLADLEERDLERDTGWDPETLRTEFGGASPGRAEEGGSES